MREYKTLHFLNYIPKGTVYAAAHQPQMMEDANFSELLEPYLKEGWEIFNFSSSALPHKDFPFEGVIGYIDILISREKPDEKSATKENEAKAPSKQVKCPHCETVQRFRLSCQKCGAKLPYPLA